MNKIMSYPAGVAAAVILAIVAMTSGSCKSGDTPEIQSMKTAMKQVIDEQAMTEENLATFDTLDFTVFSEQQWLRLHESHAKNIKVYWPDGHMTKGLDTHIDDLKGIFVYAPDTRIKQHPIRFGSGKYTAVTGVFEGTFTKPMPMGNGKFIKPTGKAFSVPMATIGIWENGIMTEEHLFWDNHACMQQMGLIK